MAVDGRLKGDETCLASSTLLANEEDKDIFGLVISYSVRVKLFLGALAGDLVAELPFVLMNPRWTQSSDWTALTSSLFRPNIHKLIKADTISRETSFNDSVDQDENVIFTMNNSDSMEMKNITHRFGVKKSNYYKLD